MGSVAKPEDVGQLNWEKGQVSLGGGEILLDGLVMSYGLCIGGIMAYGYGCGGGGRYRSG